MTHISHHTSFTSLASVHHTAVTFHMRSTTSLTSYTRSHLTSFIQNHSRASENRKSTQTMRIEEVEEPKRKEIFMKNP